MICLTKIRQTLGACGALLIAACSSPTPAPQDAPQTIPVQVDATNDDRQVSLTSFFPGTVVARPGDSIRFQLEAIGEPHTVTFGTLVDAGLRALDRLAPTTVKEAFLGEPPEMFKLPSVFGPPPTQTPENQAAGQPCFLDTGEPPVADPCPELKQPDYNGRQAFFSSGWLSETEPFEMRLASDIEPGTYRFMCLIHRGLMNARLTVVGEDEPRPGPEAVRRQAEEEIDASIARLKRPLDEAAAAPPSSGRAGTGSGERLYEFAMTFGPREMTVAAGEPVSWSLYLCHTISFNPPGEAFGDLRHEEDGSVRLNPIAYAASEAPPPPAIEFDPNAPPIRFDAGTWNGAGFFNSGGMCSLAAEDLSYTLRFSQPGTYELRCLFHPFMRGTIKVV